jgi:peptidoglycan/LPS O-acetylase OafA/YrhL
MYSGNEPLNYFQYYFNIWFGIHGMPEGFIMSDVFPEMNFGHAWFIEHLLVYAILYWCVRKIIKKPIFQQTVKHFSAAHLLIIASIIATSTFIVRIWYPIDDVRGLLGFFQVEIAHWPQYITLFFVGIIAYRKNWLATLNAKTGYAALLLGISMAIVVYSGAAILGIWAIYESFFAVFIIFGLITLFREKGNHASPFVKLLSRSSYTAYIVHFPIALCIQYMMDTANIGGAVGKFITVSVIVIVLTYTISFLLIKIKPLKIILL